MLDPVENLGESVVFLTSYFVCSGFFFSFLFLRNPEGVGPLVG